MSHEERLVPLSNVGVWKRRSSLLKKVRLALVVKGEIKVEEEVDLVEEKEGEVASKVEEDSKDQVEGIIQEVKKETSNVTIVTSMNTMREKVD